MRCHSTGNRRSIRPATGENRRSVSIQPSIKAQLKDVVVIGIYLTLLIVIL